MSEYKDIHAAIAAVYDAEGYVQKRRGQNLNYSFAGERDLIQALRPAMVDAGIYMHVVNVEQVFEEWYETSKGAQMHRARLLATVRFTHAPSGTFIDAMATGEGSDSGDKALNKAMTGAYKYALRQTFCIETGDDPDKSASQPKATEQARAGAGRAPSPEPPSPSPAAGSSPAAPNPDPQGQFPSTNEWWDEWETHRKSLGIAPSVVSGFLKLEGAVNVGRMRDAVKAWADANRVEPLELLKTIQAVPAA